MLGIKQRLAPLGLEVRKRRTDIVGILDQRDAKRRSHMKLVAFANQTNRRGPRIQHGGQHIVIRRRPARAFGHAKSGHRGASLWGGVEKVAVRRVCPGPAALDIVDAERVQHISDADLFGGRKLDALGLLAIAQGGVKEIQPLHHEPIPISLVCQYPGGGEAGGSAPNDVSRCSTVIVSTPLIYQGRNPASNSPLARQQ